MPGEIIVAGGAMRPTCQPHQKLVLLLGRRLLGVAAGVLATFSLSNVEAASLSSALPVAAGCPSPTSKPGHHTFYVDPVRGSKSGDGSLSHPWRTLSEVMDVRNKLFANAPATFIAGQGIIKPNPHAPIESGDTIYLMSGEHGRILLQGNFGGTDNKLYGFDNAEFITVAAAPNQTPIIKQLTLKGVGKWIFSGLTFAALQDIPSNGGKPFKAGGTTNDYFLVSILGPNRNIIFDKNRFMSQADTSRWTSDDWLNKRVSALVSIGGECLSYVDNDLKNIGFGLGTQRGRHVLIEGNTIDSFVDDGIDYGSSDLLIENNTITNAIVDGDGIHQDGIQGQPYGQIPVENVVINANTVVNQTRDLASPGNLQGIDEFDGVWHNVTVTNNIVATNAYHGISYFGVTGLNIINNTVVGTNQKIGTWLMTGKSKDKRESVNVTIVNNIATSFSISQADRFDHNMMSSLTAKAVKGFKPDEHVFADEEPGSVFDHYNTSFHSYDFCLAPSRAVGTGDDHLAPQRDRDGRLRTPPVDLGALAYGPICSREKRPR